MALPRVWRILFAYARCRALVRRRSTSYLLLHESHVPPLPLSGPVRRDALVAPLLARARLKEVQLRQANRLRRARLLPWLLHALGENVTRRRKKRWAALRGWRRVLKM